MVKGKNKVRTAALFATASALSVGAVVVAANTTFTDVSESNPYYESVEYLAAEGIINGFGDGTFRPDLPVTRGQAAKMIANALDADTENVEDPGFIDIPTTHQYYGAIAILANAGIINGDNGYYKQANPITQKQLATILSNMGDMPVEEALEFFEALEIDYVPAQIVTRGELSSLLASLLIWASEDEGEDLGEEQEFFNLSVLHVNDTHAHVEAFPQMVTAVKELREINPDSLLLHAGDIFSGTLYFTEFQGQADLPFLNMLDFDAVTFGNHEFDLGSSPEGHQALVDFIKGSNYPFVSANVDFSKDSRFTGLFSDLVSSDPANGKIYTGIVKEIDGEQVGIFGLTTEETKEIAFVGSIGFKNYIDEARKAVAAFEGMGVNKIIALTHIGFDDAAAIDNDQELAKYVDGIDLIVGGHTHTKLEEPVEVTRDGSTTIIVQANEYGKFLGSIDVSFDEDGVVYAYANSLYDVKEFEADPAAVALLAPFKAKIDSFSNEKIGVKLTQPLENPRVDEKGNGPSVRTSETILGNIITDGMLAKAKEYSKDPVIMAVQNGGGIRSVIPAGDVTIGQLITVLPFGNTLALADVTGAELKATFETSVAKYPEENGGFLHISGGKLVFDSTKPAGSRVVSLQYYDDKTKRYVDIEDAKTYKIATNAFTARGGDGYDVLANVYSEGRVKELGLSDWENLMEHFKSLKTIPTKTEDRIINSAK